MNAVLDAPTMSALDRCDRCGAQAYVHVTLPGGSDLRFCGHHGREFTPALQARGATVVDETHQIS